MMKRFKVLTLLEIKKSIKMFPKLIPGAVFTFVIVFAIALFANGVLNEKHEISSESRIKIGVVSYDDSTMMDIAKGFLTSQESITESLDLIFMDEDEAERRLENNELMAVMIIPDNVIKDIISGKNTPVEVRFPTNAGYEAAAFKEIGDAAVNLLASSQAGIYSVYDFYKENNRKSYIDDALDRLNERYIKTVLLREGFFENTTVVATGELGVMEYYIISGMILFLFLFGINSIVFSKEHTKEAVAMLEYNKVGISKQLIARLAGIMSNYIIITFLVLTGMKIVADIDVLLYLKLFFAMLPVIIAVSAILLLLQVCVSGKSASVMILFFAVMFQGFVTGSFIPKIMLPDVVGSVSRFTPAYYMIEQIKNVYMGNGGIMTSTLALAAVSAICIAVSCVCIKRSR